MSSPPRSRRTIALTTAPLLLGSLALLALGTPAGANPTCAVGAMTNPPPCCESGATPTMGADQACCPKGPSTDAMGTDTQQCCQGSSGTLATMGDTQTCCQGDMVSLGAYSYLVNGSPAALSSAKAGDSLTVLFHLDGQCGKLRLSFVSYNTTADHNLPDQTVFSSDTGLFGPGDHQLTIKVPPCFFQIDFVYGKVIEHFDPAHGVTYHDEGRFIDGSTGGSECVPQTTTTSTTEIPFFPSAAALTVGVLGAVGGTLFVLRRKL
jgi:hypothetical protein